MADYATRNKIETDAQAVPASPPSGSTAQEVTDANALLVRVRGAMLDVAQATIAIGSPSTRDQLAWARRTIQNPDPHTIPVLRYLLAEFDNLTAAQILAASDSGILAPIQTAVSRLALGLNLDQTP